MDNKKFKEKYDYNIEEKIHNKMKIIKNNMDLPLHEIKKIIKKHYPDITNAEIEELFIKQSKGKTINNSRTRKAEKANEDLER